ncbi:putative MPP superfamily phosphohydrolase [Georgenia soli]|uniref:Putative MPP superfamily phosphohydrolase n=1 Tax=Georgenia soli TaxID=638953 RepID=A0A2A9ELY4_9MICO|nr:metallophosphoesterase [Georgenia soli]PFG39255.1 putative MPP superfamily phosphohydrolase [Georgenia soli]
MGAGALGWALAETSMFTLRRHTVPLLPAGSRPLKLLHLSDLHLVPSQRDKVAWVRDLARNEPDLVVTTGDNMAHPDALPGVLEAYAPFLELPGAFVLGSNDYYAPKPKNPARYLLPDARTETNHAPLPSDELTDAFRSAGWKDLTNRRDRVEVAGTGITLVGVDDPHLDRDRFPAREPRTAVRAAGASPADVALHLGVSHAPYTRVLDAMHRDGCDLVLAGHTHGGQLCVPFYGALVTNCDLDRSRASGLHGWPGARPDAAGGEGSTWLNVSAGLGTSPYAPVRFTCRPEASLLTLVARGS